VNAQPGDAKQADVRPGERLTIMPLRPYDWRKSPDCYAPGARPDRADPPFLNTDAVKWRKRRSFSGYYTWTFEGSSFVLAQKHDDPDRSGAGHYWSDIYFKDNPKSKEHWPDTMKAKTYWVKFDGREALCNSQRSGDADFPTPSSTNLIMVDKIRVWQRVR
jgi:hypothetical protein